ncbi:MAG: hypothetical protein ACHQ1H_11840, partial [Nitrososphaerales archaeon]
PIDMLKILNGASSELKLPWNKPLKEWSLQELMGGYSRVKAECVELYLKCNDAGKLPAVAELWNASSIVEMFTLAILFRSGVLKTDQSIETALDYIDFGNDRQPTT